jgi:hypothetical protein
MPWWCGLQGFQPTFDRSILTSAVRGARAHHLVVVDA